MFSTKDMVEGLRKISLLFKKTANQLLTHGRCRKSVERNPISGGPDVPENTTNRRGRDALFFLFFLKTSRCSLACRASCSRIFGFWLTPIGRVRNLHVLHGCTKTESASGTSRRASVPSSSLHEGPSRARRSRNRKWVAALHKKDSVYLNEDRAKPQWCGHMKGTEKKEGERARQYSRAGTHS